MVAQMTHAGDLPRLLIEPIDFLRLYEMKRQEHKDPSGKHAE